MALGSYETALGWLGSENRKSIIRVFLDYMQLCTSKVDVSGTMLLASALHALLYSFYYCSLCVGKGIYIVI